MGKVLAWYYHYLQWCVMKKKFTTSPQFVEQSVIEALSAYEPMSHAEYAESAGIARVTAFDRIKKLKKRGLIHIKDWRRGLSGPPVPLYALGNLPDADPPAAYTSREKCRRWEEKLKKKDGGSAWRQFMARKNDSRKRLFKIDRSSADKSRASSSAWARRKHGYTPRMPNVKKLDPLLAAIMQIKPVRKDRGS